jgi:hypothetical protein
MKSFFKLLLLSVLILDLNSMSAQKSLPNGYTVSDAGEYAKDFGRKFMYLEELVGNYKNYSLSINDVDVAKTGNGWNYIVSVDISWDEVDGFTRLKYAYKGCFAFDQFGCKPIFFVTEKTEPSFLTVGERTVKIKDPKHFEILEGICPGAKWFRGLTDGCLEK